MLQTDCVFCWKIAQWDGGPESEFLNHNMNVLRFEPLNPVVPGHMLFIADEHTEFPHNNSELTGLVFSTASRWAGQHKVDYNLIVNSGADAGQTVKHMHIHYVPRVKDDGLKLPWTAQQESIRPDVSNLFTQKRGV